MRSRRKKTKGGNKRKKNMETFLESIESGLKVLEMDFKNDSWRKSLPGKPGWYFIETDTPPNTFLRKVGKPKGKYHFNIPEKAKASLSLNKKRLLCIRPSKNPFYFVWSGEAQNLKARAREHVFGPNGCACLALKNYPVLRNYKWKFYYSLCNSGNDPSESKLLRIIGEQVWRAKYGWPILCGK